MFSHWYLYKYKEIAIADLLWQNYYYFPYNYRKLAQSLLGSLENHEEFGHVKENFCINLYKSEVVNNNLFSFGIFKYILWISYHEPNSLWKVGSFFLPSW